MSTDYEITVKTGDKKYAGTDANVTIRLHGDGDQKTDALLLDNFFRNDFERGQTDLFVVTALDLADIEYLELWRDSAGLGDAWFLETVVVESKAKRHSFIFPFHKWIKENHHYKVRHLDTSLPSEDDILKEDRKRELEEIKSQYELTVADEGLPVQVKNLPDDETFSDEYKWDIQRKKLALKALSLVKEYFTGKWESLEDMKNIYTEQVLTLPDSAAHWQEDVYFGSQRLVKVNHSVITLCTSVPEKFAVTDEMLKPILEGLTIAEAIQEKRLFIIDYEILEGVPGLVCAPMGLFFVNKAQNLMPVAIQLNQKPGEGNPVFLPTDPQYTWLMAKLWFNNADCSFHQAFTHLGATHLTMEGVVTVTNRNISRSHPVYKILAPHFLYLLAINSRALAKLVAPGGWVDIAMAIGRLGMFAIVKKKMKTWRMDIQGTLPKELESRGVLDENVLPGYHYREDALPLYNIINNYVTKYVALYYDSPEKIVADHEIQNWAKEMVMDYPNGIGIQRIDKPLACVETNNIDVKFPIPFEFMYYKRGVPGNGKIENKEQLVTIVTCIIFTCSVAHAATNFAQYDQYAFPPAYPALMKGTPPTDKTPLKEDVVLAALPDKATTLDTMLITSILSDKGTNSLGDFEVQYIYDPKALVVLQEFRHELNMLSLKIKEKNRTRNPPYPWLDPEEVPNAISI